jgi:N-acetylmuramoyl-L-alanine amidase
MSTTKEKVVISPGHTKEYKGVFKNNYHEHDLVSEIVDKVMALNEKEKKLNLVKVTGTLEDKVNKIVDIYPLFAVEVHLGNSNSNRVSGSRAFHDLSDRESITLAEILLESCIRTLGTKDNGVAPGWYKKISPAEVKAGKAPEGWKPKIDIFLRKCGCPSAIVEPFFLSSIFDVRDYSQRLDDVAKALYDGMVISYDVLSTMVINE